jgi:flagellar biogenesis protein FliO
MSPLAKLLQIRPVDERQSKDMRSVAGKAWARFMELLRSTRVRRRVRRLEVVERVALGNKQSVVLVRLDERELVVGCCGDSVVLLSPAPAAVSVASAPVKIVKKQITRRPRAKAVRAKMVVQPAMASAIQAEPVPATQPVQTMDPVVAVEPVAPAAKIRIKPATTRKPRASRRAGRMVNVPTQEQLIKSFAGRA